MHYRPRQPTHSGTQKATSPGARILTAASDHHSHHVEELAQPVLQAIAVLTTLKSLRSPSCKLSLHTHHVEELAQPVLHVEELEDDAVAEGEAEEHGGVTAARVVRALEQPEHIAGEQPPHTGHGPVISHTRQSAHSRSSHV